MIKSINSRIDQTEGRISELDEDRIFMHSEEIKEKNEE
jgi:hypothetical protein